MHLIQKVFDAHPRDSFTSSKLAEYTGLTIEMIEHHLQNMLNSRSIQVVPECRDVKYYRRSHAR